MPALDINVLVRYVVQQDEAAADARALAARAHRRSN
jgi:hypothetical protein